MPRKIKAVLFDADGTLIDSWDRMMAGHRAVFESHQLPLPSKKEIIRRFRLPSQGFYKEYGISLSREEIREIYARASSQVSVSVYDDVHSGLERLHAMGLRLGIVSGQSMDVIHVCLNASARYFGIIVSRAKGKAEEIRLICKGEGWLPDEVYYVGDSADDIKSAREAEVIPVGITRGESHEDEDVHDVAQILMDAGASATVFNLHELQRLIELRSCF